MNNELESIMQSVEMITRYLVVCSVFSSSFSRLQRLRSSSRRKGMSVNETVAAESNVPNRLPAKIRTLKSRTCSKRSLFKECSWLNDRFSTVRFLKGSYASGLNGPWWLRIRWFKWHLKWYKQSLCIIHSYNWCVIGGSFILDIVLVYANLSMLYDAVVHVTTFHAFLYM